MFGSETISFFMQFHLPYFSSGDFECASAAFKTLDFYILCSCGSGAFQNYYKLDLAERKHFSKFRFQVFVAANVLAYFLRNSHLGFRGDRRTGPLTRTYLTSIAILV